MKINVTLDVPNGDECGGYEYKESELYWHEALDRSSLATDFFSENVENHPAVQHDEELKKEAERITMIMAEFYQKVGHKSYDFDQKPPQCRSSEVQGQSNIPGKIMAI